MLWCQSSQQTTSQLNQQWGAGVKSTGEDHGAKTPEWLRVLSAFMLFWRSLKMKGCNLEIIDHFHKEVWSEGAGFRHQVLKEDRYHDIERVLQRPWGFTSLAKWAALFWTTYPITSCSELLWKTEMTKDICFQNMTVKMMSILGQRSVELMSKLWDVCDQCCCPVNRGAWVYFGGKEKE